MRIFQWSHHPGVSRTLLAGVFLLLPLTGLAEARQSVAMVGNAEGGTVSFLDARTFENLGSFNAVPDLDWRLFLSAFQPVRAICREVVQTQKGEKYVDDLRLLPDGRTLVVSRGTLGDVAAFDLTTGEMLWREDVGGCLADHMAVSPDGDRAVVSDILLGRVLVLNTDNGERVAEYPGGTFPHGNHFSHDGQRVYTGAMGSPILPYELNALKGKTRLSVVETGSWKVQQVHSFDYGVRPFAVTDDESLAYIQLSFQRGFIEFDLGAGQIVRDIDLPASDAGQGMDPNDYPMDSAHHGLALSGDERHLCNAGTIDDYVAILDRANFGRTIIDTGDIPYWATTAPGGEHCLVSNSGDDEVAVFSYEPAAQVKRVPVGDFPQRIRNGEVLPAVIDNLSSQ